MPSDQTSRKPRQIQIDLYNQVLNATSPVIGVNAVPGSGKSFLARALQVQSPSCDILTSANHLVSQYKDSYPVLNVVTGKDTYDSAEDYHEAHARAARGYDSIFNPLSYHYARERGLRKPDMVVVDEAHLFADMLMAQASIIIPVSRTKAPENARSELDLIKWCYRRYDLLKKELQKPDTPPMVLREFAKISRLRDCLEEGTEKQVFQIHKEMIPYVGGRKQKCLVLTPVRVPSRLIKNTTDARRAVFMSGTMSIFDMEQLCAGRDGKLISTGYLTPPENRPVFFDPIDERDRRDVSVIAERIEEIYLKNKVPTLVHTTYTQSRELRGYLSHLKPLVNKTDDKDDIKDRFVNNGGLWLASGCAEGLDLPYDTCRQIIIPNILYPDRTDLFVQKRCGLEDGDKWYSVRAMQSTIQRIGRGIRAEDDACVTHILDWTFPRLVEKTQGEFDPLAIQWSKM